MTNISLNVTKVARTGNNKSKNANAVISLIAIFLLFSSFNTYGYDRLGSDYANPLVSIPTDCATLCDRDPKCKSWTFVKPPLKHPTSPVCFLKDAVPAPSFNTTCPSNAECLSGVKDSRGQWCGESPKFTVSGVLMGQDVVVNCPSGLTCKSILAPATQKPWYCFFLPFLDVCQPVKTQSLDLFCQP